MNRRDFFGKIGLGATAVALAPVALALPRMPSLWQPSETRTIFLPQSGGWLTPAFQYPTPEQLREIALDPRNACRTSIPRLIGERPVFQIGWDECGDIETLNDLISAVDPGATFAVGERIYRIAPPLRLDKPITIRNAERTRIYWRS